MIVSAIDGKVVEAAHLFAPDVVGAIRSRLLALLRLLDFELLQNLLNVIGGLLGEAKVEAEGLVHARDILEGRFGALQTVSERLLRQFEQQLGEERGEVDAGDTCPVHVIIKLLHELRLFEVLRLLRKDPNRLAILQVFKDVRQAGWRASGLDDAIDADLDVTLLRELLAGLEVVLRDDSHVDLPLAEVECDQGAACFVPKQCSEEARTGCVCVLCAEFFGLKQRQGVWRVFEVEDAFCHFGEGLFHVGCGLCIYF